MRLYETSHGVLQDYQHAFAQPEHRCRLPHKTQAGSQTLQAATLHTPNQYGTHGASGAPGAKESGQNLTGHAPARKLLLSQNPYCLCLLKAESGRTHPRALALQAPH